jgi:hypothetical protein
VVYAKSLTRHHLVQDSYSTSRSQCPRASHSFSAPNISVDALASSPCHLKPPRSRRLCLPRVGHSVRPPGHACSAPNVRKQSLRVGSSARQYGPLVIHPLLHILVSKVIRPAGRRNHFVVQDGYSASRSDGPSAESFRSLFLVVSNSHFLLHNRALVCSN